jgi:hypothetical protein
MLPRNCFEQLATVGAVDVAIGCRNCCRVQIVIFRRNSESHQSINHRLLRPAMKRSDWRSFT